MSLLLDALKKAAEQKAQKSKPEEPEQSSSDETLLDVAGAEDALRRADDSAVESGRDDETEFDPAEIDARVEKVERIADDDTGLDVADSIWTRADSIPQQAPPSEETRLDDLAEATETAQSMHTAEPHGPDDTGLEIPEETRTRLQPEQPEHADGDETGLDLSQAAGDSPQPDTPVKSDSGEDTGLDYPGSDRTAAAEQDRQMQTGKDEDIILSKDDVSDFMADRETDLRHPILGDDETDLSQLHAERRQDEVSQVEIAADAEADSSASPADSNQTDFSVPVKRADQIETASPDLPDAAAGDESETEGVVDEDLSLLLVEAEQTGASDDSSFTDPRIPPARTPADVESPIPGLELEDVTQSKLPEEQVDAQSSTLTDATATGVSEDDTRTKTGGIPIPRQSTVTRADATSTRTYAPDNYDRTLMRLPGDDASKLFAGMKSDSDVVMTPDYAKKVFQSKTSAQRAQHYKYYGAIVLVLLLAVGIYGSIEYQGEADSIDSSLRPLKRDPMPGLVNSREQEQQTDLFAGADGQVDARTLEIIQSAGAEAEPSVVGETATDSAPSEADAETGDSTVAEVETAQQAQAAQRAQAAQQVEAAQEEQQARIDPAAGGTSEESVPTEEVVVATLSRSQSQQDAGPADESETPANLQIKTESQYRQADIWLREAYSAYRAGDIELALQRYNQVLGVDRSNRNALLARAAIQVQNGNIEAAIRDYQTLLLLNPKDTIAMSSLLGVGSYSPLETESQLKLMIRDEPDSPYLNFALANSYGAQSRWREAQVYYFKALQNNPDDPNYAYNLAVSLEHISQPDSAVAYYRRALDNFDKGLATFSREVVSQRLQVLGKP